MVNVGVIGLGPEWESRFGPALRKLRERIAIRAVYDPVASRAAQVADEWRADVMEGLRALTERADIRGLLLLDAGWGGWETVRLALAARKPLFVVSGFRNNEPELSRFHQRAMSEGQTVMPAFGLRYTPATCRLRELIATCLGPAKSISVSITPSSAALETSFICTERDQLVAAADWCRYVVGTSPTRVTADGESVQLEFPGKSHRANVQAELSFTSQLAADAGRYPIGTEMTPEARLQAVVCCVNGTASLRSVTQIDWEHGGETASESLASERTATEVMFDLFCRRVVGGLIPVADISDVMRGARLVDAVGKSCELGTPIEIDGNCRK